MSSERLILLCALAWIGVVFVGIVLDYLANPTKRRFRPARSAVPRSRRERARARRSDREDAAEPESADIVVARPVSTVSPPATDDGADQGGEADDSDVADDDLAWVDGTDGGGPRRGLDEVALAPTAQGTTPSRSTVRRRFWKHMATQPTASGYGSVNQMRMQRGAAPRRFNPVTGSVETLQLSQNDDRVDARWPTAGVDPFASDPDEAQ